MATAVAVIVLLPLFFTSSDCHAQDVHAILLKVVDAVEKLISFYKTSYQNLNLDGLFGLKVVEGMAAFNSSVPSLSVWHKWQTPLKRRIQLRHSISHNLTV